MTLRNKDYYKILQVDPSAEQEVIEAAYKRLVRMYHPDINKSPDATIRMQEINAAYALLRSPAKRVQYDKERSFQSSWSDAKYAEECRRREEAEATRRRTEIEELLESSRDLIRQQLGQPDREGLHSDGFYFDCFYKAGVVVCYDKAGKAVKVEATQFVSGE
jgi:curved DNA-binding protein CbpA